MSGVTPASVSTIHCKSLTLFVLDFSNISPPYLVHKGGNKTQIKVIQEFKETNQKHQQNISFLFSFEAGKENN